MAVTVSVVVITYLRPESVAECLDRLARQTEPADQVVVVDASPDDATRRVVATYPEVTYLPNASGAGNMTNSRNAALPVVTGDVIAFLDDDAYVEPSYLAELRKACAAPSVEMGCCRTLNDEVGEDSNGLTQIGKLAQDGELTGFFAADPGQLLGIDHGIGATMFFRASVIDELGKFREEYRGTSIREDADVFLRANALGHHAFFVPSAVARHVGAPHAVGMRFDLRYHYWAHRNHVVLLANNFGLSTPMLRHFAVRTTRKTLQQTERRRSRRGLRALVGVWGMLRGLGIILGRGQWKAMSATQSTPPTLRHRAPR